MNPLDLKLYELLGDKTLSFGCKVQLLEINDNRIYEVLGRKPNNYGCFSTVMQRGDLLPLSFVDGIQPMKIIGHEPTIADLHRMVCRDSAQFYQNRRTISISVKHKERDGILTDFMVCDITYDASLALLQQSEETKQAIISLIESHEK